MKGRRWTEEEDQLLRESVLKSISEGGTQLDAFEEVGRKLGRTAGACGFRWNAVLRQQDPHAYTEAKKKRVYQQLQKKRGSQMDSFSQVIHFLRQEEKGWKQLKDEVQHLSRQLAEKKERYELLLDENKKLKEEKYSYDWYQQEVKEKYQDLLLLLKSIREEMNTDLFTELKNPKSREVSVDTDRNSSS